jgi:hypothetical protein
LFTLTPLWKTAARGTQRKSPASGGALRGKPVLLAGLLLALPVLILLLLARPLAAALLLAGFLTRVLALLSGMSLVRHARSPFR